MLDEGSPRRFDPPARASHARGKLDAAIEGFGLAGRIRGAEVLDVGAGAGGFIEALLAHGARRVVGIDVGTGQLRPHLASDPRVDSMEGIDFRQLPPRIAPGPFDFFSVDVSFAAGRNVLRGLGLRLRPGAEGVLLIKPQFELPPRVWSRSKEPPEQLRERAVARVREKATRLGFELRATRQSPVPGHGGTIEVLAHLVFLGSPRAREAVPPGVGIAPIPVPSAQARALETHAELTWFAVATPGGEAVTAREIARLSLASSLRELPGGVEFSGPLELGWRANLELRTATRILLRMGSFRARDFGMLRWRTARLPWRRFLPAGTPVSLRVSQSRSRLYHTGAIAENVALGLDDALGRADAPEPEGEAQLILVRGDADRWTFSLDASGERLHRRGWRTETGAASLRETLASIVLELAEWSPSEPLVDALCGVGTFAIEAATRALGRPPGALRPFACERWSGVPLERWLELRDASLRAVRASPPARILGVDRDARSIEAAQRNAERAGCAAAVEFVCAPLEALEAPEGPGLVLMNPPYGVRLGRPAQLDRIYTELGQALRQRFPGWRVGVLVPQRRLVSALGLRPSARHRLRNGGLEVELLIAKL